jgi:hypothetical protein
MIKFGIALSGALVLLCMLSLVIWGNSLPRARVYDCSLAEFHPDYPAEVKNECRRIRSQKLTTI